MLFLLPVIIFGLAAIGITALRWRGMRMGYIWLLPFVLTLATWLTLLILPVPTSPQMQEWNWLKLAGEYITFQLIVDSTNWSFVFLLVSLVMVYFLTLTVRLVSEKRTILWVAWLLQGAIAVLAVTAGNLITLLLMWTLIDLLDYGFSRFVFKTVDPSLSPGSFLPSMLAILLMMLAVVYSSEASGSLSVETLSMPSGVLLFFAALLHMGILPLRRPTNMDESVCQSFGFFNRLVLIVTGLALFSRLPVALFSPVFTQLMVAFFWLLSLSFTILGYKEKASLEYWCNALVCLAAIAVLGGQPLSTPAWCAVICVGIGMHQFYRVRTTQLGIFTWLTVAAISALPFTIASNALQGLMQGNNLVWVILSLPIYALLLIDFSRKTGAEKERTGQMEAWYQAVYLFGLFLLILVPFALVVKNSNYLANAMQNWWLGAVVAALAIGGRIIISKLTFRGKTIKRINVLVIRIGRIFTFEWLADLYAWLALIIQEVINFATQLLEGEGGIIWAIVILALMISLVAAGRI